MVSAQQDFDLPIASTVFSSYLTIQVTRLATHKLIRSLLRWFLAWIFIPWWLTSLAFSPLWRRRKPILRYCTQIFGTLITPILMPLKLLTYFTATFASTATYISLTAALLSSRIPVRTRPSPQPEIHSVSIKKLNFSSFMTFESWNGFLRKLGHHPVDLINQIHRIGKNAILLLVIFNALSVKATASDLTSVYNTYTPSVSSMTGHLQQTSNAIFAAPSATLSFASKFHTDLLESRPIPQTAFVKLPSEGAIDWDTDQLPAITTAPLPAVAYFLDDATCLSTDVVDIGDCVVLANNKTSSSDAFEFIPKVT